MSVEFLKTFFLVSTLIHYAILFIWFLAIVFANDFMFKLHTRWFAISRPTFDSIHYAGIAFYKVGVLLTSLVPWIALCILTGGP